MALSYVCCLLLRPTFAATAPRSAVAELGVVRRFYVHRVNESLPETSFELSISGGGVALTIRSIARHPLQETNICTMHFPSVATLRSQLQHISRRIHEPRRALSSVPWPRCWPPYRLRHRQASFFVGSFSSFSHGRRQRHISFALASYLASPLVWCVSRDVSGFVFALPPTFSDSVIAALPNERNA